MATVEAYPQCEHDEGFDCERIATVRIEASGLGDYNGDNKAAWSGHMCAKHAAKLVRKYASSVYLEPTTQIVIASNKKEA